MDRKGVSKDDDCNGPIPSKSLLPRILKHDIIKIFGVQRLSILHYCYYLEVLRNTHTERLQLRLPSA